MKALLFFSIALILFLLGCRGLSSKDEIEEFIPGTYARQSEGEFGKSYDTLVISLQNKAANQFRRPKKKKR